MNKNIVLMHNNSSLYNSLFDIISPQYNCIVLKASASELKKIPDDMNVDLFIIDITDIAKADILYMCDRLNTKRFASSPVIHSGPYASHTIFASKISALRKTKYISGADFSALPNDITMVLGNSSAASGDTNSKGSKAVPDISSLMKDSETEPEVKQEVKSDMSTSENIQAASNAAAVPGISPSVHVKSSPDKKTILVIDDDVNILTTVAKYLNKEYTVISVRTTALAFMKMGVKKPDLILLDYMMPICNGLQTLEMIRNQFETSKIPVIMLTSFTEKERVLQCFELGISGYLVKPVSKEDLLDAVHKVLP